MKAEERHQLKENDLSSWLQYGLPMFLKQNGSYIVLVVALAFLGFQLWSLHVRRQEEYRDNAQLEFDQVPYVIVGKSSEPGEATHLVGDDKAFARLHNIIDTYDIKELKALSYLKLGIIYPQVILFPDAFPMLKMSRSEVLDKTEQSYKSALDLGGDDLLIVGQADLGLAAVSEDRGNWDDARKTYELLTDKNGRFANTPFAGIAASRLATLDDRRKAPPLISMATALVMHPAIPGTNPLNLPGKFGPQLPGVTPGPESPTTPTTGPGADMGGPGSVLPFSGPLMPSTGAIAPPGGKPVEALPEIAPPATTPAAK